MKNKNLELLSDKLIEREDLLRLLDLARKDRHDFFTRHPDWAKLYADRILGTALCQGAALHYIRPNVGINDFDVYTFYAAHPDRKWYAKRLKSVDFGDAKFGISEISRSGFVGRRVDLMGRELDVEPGTDLVSAIRSYLIAGKSDTARELSQKAVIVLEPIEKLGTVAWPSE